MKKYLSHLKKLYQRPVLNGIDGEIQERYANPFELFFDLIFVIALSKLAILLKIGGTIYFIQTILMFSVIYTIWFTLTKYTVMFLKKDTNYWTRASIFIVMLPMVFFLSITDVTSPLGNFTFYFTLALSKFSLAVIFRDSIVNAPLNHITVSRVYKEIAKYKIVVTILLIINALVLNHTIQLSVLGIITLIEVFIIPKQTRKITRSLPFKMPMNYNLFIERQLLFLILVFGESLVTLVHHIDYQHGFLSIVNVFVMFLTMFLFYIRISEEVEHNPKWIRHSNNVFYWLRVNLSVFVLYQELSEISAEYAHDNTINQSSVLIIIAVLIYIVFEYFRLNTQNLKVKTAEQKRKFYIVDTKLLFVMLVIPGLLFFMHSSLLMINILLLIFFGLHVIALPLREHLLEKYDY